MKTYQTMMTPDYIPDWSVADGIREFIANALDSDSRLEYDVGDDYITLTSVGVTLPAQVLTIGTSGNRLKDSAVGKHGEGILAGLIPILREGGYVEFQNGDKLWTPSFKYSEDFERQILVIEETQYAAGNTNFTVSITYIDSDIISEVVDRCLYLQKDIGKVLEGERGRVLLERSGKLYVGGLFVCDTNTEYAYDFHPRYLPLNRDRKSVSNWDLTENTTKLLQEVLPAREAAVLTARSSLDAGGYGYARFDSDEIAEESYNLVKEQFGELVVVASDYTEKEKLEKRGFKNVEIIYKENQRKLIQQAPSYQEFLDELEQVVQAVEPEDARSPIEMLEDWVETFTFEYSSDEVSFKELLDTFKQRGVSFDS